MQGSNDDTEQIVPKLQDLTWQLLATLQKSWDTHTMQELPNDSWWSRTLPSASALSLPLGLEKHLSPLPFSHASSTGKMYTVLPVNKGRVNVQYRKVGVTF